MTDEYESTPPFVKQTIQGVFEIRSTQDSETVTSTGETIDEAWLNLIERLTKRNPTKKKLTLTTIIHITLAEERIITDDF